MPNYTEFLNLEKPLQSEQYNVDVFNSNCDKIDNFAKSQIVPIATYERVGVVKPDGETIFIEEDGTISSSTDAANKDLSNLTTLGNSRLQYAPFAINNGRITNTGANATVTTLSDTEVAWTQPTMTANGVLGGSSFAVEASSVYSTTYDTYRAFDNNADTQWLSDIPTNVTFPVNLIIYNPDPIKVTNIVMTNRLTYLGSFTEGSVYGSNDNSTWTQVAIFSNDVTAAGSQWSINLSSNTNFYNYYKIEFTNGVSGSSTYSYGLTQVTLTATQQVLNGLTCYPCTITTCDGRTKVFDSAASLDVSNEADGDYFIFKDYTTGNLSLKNDLNISKTPPVAYTLISSSANAIGSAPASSYTSYTASKAFAGDTSSHFITPKTGAYLGQSGLTQNVKKIKKYVASAADIYTCTAQYSLDSTTWTDIQNITFGSEIGSWYEVTINDYPSASYFRLNNLQSNSTSANMTIYETEFYAEEISDNWLDISTIPANLKELDNGLWVVNNDIVCLGGCSVSSGAVTALTNREFNDSGYLVERNYPSVFYSLYPDMEHPISLPSGISGSYTAPSDGYLSGYVQAAINTVVTFSIDGMDISSVTSGAHSWSYFYPVLKGTTHTYSADIHAQLTGMRFYPLKGVK